MALTVGQLRAMIADLPEDMEVWRVRNGDDVFTGLRYCMDATEVVARTDVRIGVTTPVAVIV